MPNQFKPGDKIVMTKDCGQSFKGSLYILTKDKYGDLNANGCECQQFLKLVEPELTLEGFIAEIEKCCLKIESGTYNKQLDNGDKTIIDLSQDSYLLPQPLLDKYRTQSPELKAHIKALEDAGYEVKKK